MQNTAPKFIRIFNIEAQAKAYATAKGGVITVRYDYDKFKGGIIKTFVVKY